MPSGTTCGKRPIVGKPTRSADQLAKLADLRDRE